MHPGCSPVHPGCNPVHPAPCTQPRAPRLQPHVIQVPDEALAPMGLAAAQALAAGRKALAARKPPAAGDAATQQKTLSRLGLPRHMAFFEAEEAALEQVSSQLGSAVRFSAGGFVGFGEAAGSVTWVVEVSKNGIYRLVFLYASKVRVTRTRTRTRTRSLTSSSPPPRPTRA